MVKKKYLENGPERLEPLTTSFTVSAAGTAIGLMLKIRLWRLLKGKGVSRRTRPSAQIQKKLN